MFECVICTVEDECGTVPHFEPDCFVRGCAADDDHRCHFECIENYVRNEITKWPDTTSEKLKCPGPGCMGRRELPQCEITPHQVHGMQGLERSIKEKYDRIRLVQVLREAHGDSLKACPRGCGYFVLAPDARQKWMPCKICREPDGSELVMCLECHRRGVTKQDLSNGGGAGGLFSTHQSSHPYFVYDNLAFPLLMKDWTAKDEL
jgi:hypothetical protein